MILTGRMVRAKEARSVGLVHQLVEAHDRLAGAMTISRRFSGFSLVAQAHAREAVRRAMSMPLADGLAVEAGLSTHAFGSHDAREGILAFIERRPAQFSDR